MPTETRRINRLALQIAQDGHLSFGQKWRSLVMQSFGHEGLIETDALLKNGHCPDLNTDIYRLKPIKWKHLAWRKILNPFKIIAFILSLLEFLPWWFQRSPVKSLGCIHEEEGAFRTCIDILEKGYWFLAWHLFFPLLNVTVHFILSIANLFLSPVIHFIRPSIQLAKKSPLLFSLMLLLTLALTAFFAWFLLTGSFSLVIGGALLTSTFAAQLGVIALSAFVLWGLLLKFQNLVSQLYGLYQQIEPNILKQSIEVYPDQKGQTDNMSRLYHRLNPENTQIRAPEEQGFCYSFALFTGTESFFYPKAKEEKDSHTYIHFITHAFYNIPYKEEAVDFFDKMSLEEIKKLLEIINPSIALTNAIELEEAREIFAQQIVLKIKNIQDIRVANQAIELLLYRDNGENHLEGARLIRDNQAEAEGASKEYPSACCL